MTNHSDSRETDGGTSALMELTDIQPIVEQAETLLGTQVLSRLCNVTKPTIRRYAKGTSNPSPDNATRIRFALTLGTSVRYQYNARVAGTFFNAANPWLD